MVAFVSVAASLLGFVALLGLLVWMSFCPPRTWGALVRFLWRRSPERLRALIEAYPPVPEPVYVSDRTLAARRRYPSSAPRRAEPPPPPSYTVPASRLRWAVALCRMTDNDPQAVLLLHQVAADLARVLFVRRDPAARELAQLARRVRTDLYRKTGQDQVPEAPAPDAELG